MTTAEPLYTQRDVAELMALAVYRDSLCPLCGGPLEECTSHEETGPAFAAEVIAACRKTLAKLEVQRAMTDGGKKPMPPNSPAYLWAVKTKKR